MGWIENGPQKSEGGFLSINRFPPKLKKYLLDLSVLFEIGELVSNLAGKFRLTNSHLVLIICQCIPGHHLSFFYLLPFFVSLCLAILGFSFRALRKKASFA